MPRIKIYVTAEDIANGLRGSKEGCPVARGIRRGTGCYMACVNRKSWSNGRGFNRRLGTSVVSFIMDFDAGLPVEPFNFFTEVPDA